MSQYSGIFLIWPHRVVKKNSIHTAAILRVLARGRKYGLGEPLRKSCQRSKLPEGFSLNFLLFRKYLPGTTNGDRPFWIISWAESTGGSTAGFRRIARKLQRRMCWRKLPEMDQRAETTLAENPWVIFSPIKLLKCVSPFFLLSVFGTDKLILE